MASSSTQFRTEYGALYLRSQYSVSIRTKYLSVGSSSQWIPWSEEGGAAGHAGLVERGEARWAPLPKRVHAGGRERGRHLRYVRKRTSNVGRLEGWKVGSCGKHGKLRKIRSKRRSMEPVRSTQTVLNGQTTTSQWQGWQTAG